MKGFDHPDTTKMWDRMYYREPLAVEYYDRAIHKTLDMLQATDSDKILDAGCGAGVHAIRAASRGLKLDAIDFSQAALEDAGQRARQAGVQDKIAFLHEDLTKLTFSDSSYNKIFSWGVLIHIPQVDKALDELARVLTVGGRLALYVCTSTSLQFAPRRLQSWLRPRSAKWHHRQFGYATEFTLHDESIWLWHFDIAAIENHLHKHGLRLVARHAGEFCDLHLRFDGTLGRVIWRTNNLWFRLGLPARLAQMSILVFEKSN